MKVSFIVPVYNEGLVLQNSIESLLDIDYPNYEIITVNDSSTDDTIIVAEGLVGYQRGRSVLVKISLINKPKLNMSSLIENIKKTSTA